MSRIRFVVAGILLAGFGLGTSCGDGGSDGGGSPFPPAVSQLFGDLDADLRAGSPNLSPGISCGGGPVSNPLDTENDNQVVVIAGSGRANAGSVAQVRLIQTETRDPATGSDTIRLTIADEADPSRVFLDLSGSTGVPVIQFLPPPLGATEFLDVDGAGQSFAILKVQNTLALTRTFVNNPAPTGNGDLVGFTGIPLQPDGTDSATVHMEDIWLAEFAVTAGPPNTACVAGFHYLGEVLTINRTGASMLATPLYHSFRLSIDAPGGAVGAYANAHAVIVAIGDHGLPASPVPDGSAFHLLGGVISGGIGGYDPLLNGNDIDDAGGAVVITDDGVGAPNDGSFNGVSTFAIDALFDITPFPGGLGNGNVEVSDLELNSAQIEDLSMTFLDHPIEDPPCVTDLGPLLYLPVVSIRETGIVIYR